MILIENIIKNLDFINILILIFDFILYKIYYNIKFTRF